MIAFIFFLLDYLKQLNFLHRGKIDYWGESLKHIEKGIVVRSLRYHALRHSLHVLSPHLLTYLKLHKHIHTYFSVEKFEISENLHIVSDIL